MSTENWRKSYESLTNISSKNALIIKKHKRNCARSRRASKAYKPIAKVSSKKPRKERTMNET